MWKKLSKAISKHWCCALIFLKQLLTSFTLYRCIWISLAPPPPSLSYLSSRVDKNLPLSLLFMCNMYICKFHSYKLCTVFLKFHFYIPFVKFVSICVQNWPKLIKYLCLLYIVYEKIKRCNSFRPYFHFLHLQMNIFFHLFSVFLCRWTYSLFSLIHLQFPLLWDWIPQILMNNISSIQKIKNKNPRYPSIFCNISVNKKLEFLSFQNSSLMIRYS